MSSLRVKPEPTTARVGFFLLEEKDERKRMAKDYLSRVHELDATLLLIAYYDTTTALTTSAQLPLLRRPIELGRSDAGDSISGIQLACFKITVAPSNS